MGNCIEIKKYENINDVDAADLHSILNGCHDYDLYTDDGFPIYIAFFNGSPAGILTYIVSAYEITPEALIDDSDFPSSGAFKKDPEYEAEIRCFVAPEYRGKRVCTELLSAVKNELNDTYPIVYSLPPALLSSSLAAFPFYGELLFSLEKDVLTPDDLDIQKNELIKNISEMFNMDDLTISAIPSIDNKRFELFINDRLIACLSTSYSDSMCFIHNVYVSPKLRGLKLGNFLLGSAMAHHFSSHTLPVLVNTKTSNVPACNLYIKTGFTEIEKIWFYKLM